jgi:hypothetical protein
MDYMNVSLEVIKTVVGYEGFNDIFGNVVDMEGKLLGYFSGSQCQETGQEFVEFIYSLADGQPWV